MSALSRSPTGRAGSATTMKIRIPRRPRGAVPRPHVERMVDAVPVAGADGELAQVVPRAAAESGFVAEVAELLAACHRPLWLVLDEIEHLTDPEAIRSVELMLRWAREPVRIILAGRSEPPIALHRLRLAGRLVEIRGRDLAFSADDAARLLAGHGVHLDEDDLALLVGRTEGWAAAIRLAAISLEGVADTHGHVVHFAGDDLAVADYLVGEILARQPPDVREFLVRTCVCDEVSPELATLLTEREDAGAVLEALVRRNVLTTVLGRHGGWYRYHGLLGSYLRAELERRSPALRRSLHRTAAAWLEEHEEPVRALEHAVAGEDQGEIAGLARRHGLGAVLAGHAVEVSRIVATLRPDLHEDPWIALVSCAAALDRGQVEVADRWLRRAPACGGDPAAEALRAVLTLAGTHRRDGGTQRRGDRVRRAEGLVPQRRVCVRLVWYSSAALELATRYEVTDDRHKAAVEAGRLWANVGSVHLAPSLVAYAALPHHRMCMQVGEFEHARGIARVTRERLGDGGEARLLDATLADLSDDRARAHRSLAEALRIAGRIQALRPFHDGGEAVRTLLAAGGGSFGHDDAFATRVREKLRPGPAGPTGLLTEREREVLAELPSMRTAAEIADDLFVSTNTVKTHMRRIYRKLGVPHRRAAVVEARCQGLL